MNAPHNADTASIPGIGSSRGLFGRAFAVRVAWCRGKGGSAPSGDHLTTAISSLALFLMLLTFALIPAVASADTGCPNEAFRASASANLPDCRAFELVSPPDKRPQGSVRAQFGSHFVTAQAAEDGQSLLFPLLGGLADTDSGGDTSYLAKRFSTAWQSTKVSPPSLIPAPTNGTFGDPVSGFVAYNSPDLSCGVINTFNPLTADTPVADIELGVRNLYRRNPNGSHTLITSTVPANPGIRPFGDFPVGIVAGASYDCGRIYFQSPYQYLHDPSGLYEWDEGTLRDAGRLPNGATPVGQVALGGENGVGSRVNSVSRDGSRFFITAVSNEGGNSGKPAVLVRKSPTETVDASQKQGGAHDSLGARYETASPDGSHLFFTANYGLTPALSSGPTEDCSNTALGSVKACDLYDYDVDTEILKDLTATTALGNPNGAVVQGVVAVSNDGSSVYFAARGQLVSGEGKTYAQNIAGPVADQSANVYLARDDQLSYVATVAAADVMNLGTLLMREVGWTAETTPDGEYLLFPSGVNVTGYDSGGVTEAYLYSAGTGVTQCISCRPDGNPSVGGFAKPLIQSFPHSPAMQSQPRKMSDDGSRVFFHMTDVLALGAVSGKVNLYEWEQGQIYLLLAGIASESEYLDGASNSGDDVFFSTPLQLDPHDTDFVADAYDARVGGGFPPPALPLVPCQVDESVPLLPGQTYCQGTQAVAPGPSSSANADFSGPGNPPVKKKCGKGKVLKHGKCLKKKRRKHPRAANANRGGAK